MRFSPRRPKREHGDDRSGAVGRVVPDSTAAVSVAAREEARKGTAAADPVIGFTPEGQMLAGSVVDGEFVAAESGATPEKIERKKSDDPVESGELPGENEPMKHVWWARRRRSGRG
ncbi:hypothetical protein KDK95_23480 [Actinospica sp. MGRD01-02]|uniref:Uncharacterized protein n=1 Tax=Actinospica acidithermotolerans TaxID=2828514 RepID=A0A941IJC1_9ACTN|nr:hypothetical protein [Actinospica acidithermotolerans]MBR7829289.1 hypothetical protein [Actinospica acidithermotolerans]